MKQQGFILMTVILILMVMTLWLVNDFRGVILEWKRSNALHRFQERSQQLDHIAEAFALKFSNKKICRLEEQLNDEQIKHLIAKNACVFAGKYHYGVTDLGVYPCVKLSSKLSTHHWLISMMDPDLPKRLVQLRVVTAETDEFCDKNQVSYVKAGILVRRWG